jgi:hypothetical protein
MTKAWSKARDARERYVRGNLTLRDMSTRKRHDVLWMALDFVLQDLNRIEASQWSTAEIAQALRERLAFPATEIPIVLTWLKKVAPLVPEATQTGEAVRVYGNIGRRWVWTPRARVAKLGDPELEFERERAKHLAARVDDGDW